MFQGIDKQPDSARKIIIITATAFYKEDSSTKKIIPPERRGARSRNTTLKAFYTNNLYAFNLPDTTKNDLGNNNGTTVSQHLFSTDRKSVV